MKIVKMGLVALLLSAAFIAATSGDALADKKKPNVSRSAREANKIECDVLGGTVSAEGVETQSDGSRWGYIDCDFSSGDIDVCRFYDNGKHLCASVKISPNSGDPRQPRTSPVNAPRNAGSIGQPGNGLPSTNPSGIRNRAAP